eukprot:c29052_g4_i1 orf=615-2210(+)
MAAFTKRSTCISSFFPETRLNGIDSRSDSRVEVQVGVKDTATFRNRPNEVSPGAGDRDLNEHKDYVISEKEMVLDAHNCVNGDGFLTNSPNVDGILDITIHHARDIQNICIYGNQDVYAKFSLTNSKDETFSTEPVAAGGRNPVFNQSLQIPVSLLDSTLKCEVWMMSCARSYLQDQLLGFVLVPLTCLVGKGKFTQDYPLSSTELFHTPAGTVSLSLAFNSGLESHNKMHTDDSLLACSSPGSPEFVVIDDVKPDLSVEDYNKIEFPDLQDASDNQHILSVYFNITSGDLKADSGSDGGASERNQGLPGLSFLQLGSSSTAEMDCEMTLNIGGDCQKACQLLNLGPFPDLTNLSHVESLSSKTFTNSVPSSTVDHKSRIDQVQNNSALHVSASSRTSLPNSGSVFSTAESLDCPSSMMQTTENNEPGMMENKGNIEKGITTNKADERTTFSNPLVNIALEPEEPVVQQQIVDLYMKSMQQFTESLSKMNLPLDLDTPSQMQPTNKKEEATCGQVGKNKGHKVFYGSRAFF